jgi:hypothetical protein
VRCDNDDVPGLGAEAGDALRLTDESVVRRDFPDGVIGLALGDRGDDASLATVGEDGVGDPPFIRTSSWSLMFEWDLIIRIP